MKSPLEVRLRVGVDLLVACLLWLAPDVDGRHARVGSGRMYYMGPACHIVVCAVYRGGNSVVPFWALSYRLTWLEQADQVSVLSVERTWSEGKDTN